MLIERLEGIDMFSTLRDTLRFPNTKYPTPRLNCCRLNGYSGQSIHPFIAEVTKLCRDKIEKIPSLATFLGFKA